MTRLSRPLVTARSLATSQPSIRFLKFSKSGGILLTSRPLSLSRIWKCDIRWTYVLQIYHQGIAVAMCDRRHSNMLLPKILDFSELLLKLDCHLCCGTKISRFNWESASCVYWFLHVPDGYEVSCHVPVGIVLWKLDSLSEYGYLLLHQKESYRGPRHQNISNLLWVSNMIGSFGALESINTVFTECLHTPHPGGHCIPLF